MSRIAQRAGDALRACACHRTKIASRAVTRMYDEWLRPSGLRATQFLVLVAVLETEAISITQLADKLGMDRTTLKRALTPLETEKLVRLGNEGWRRSRTIRLTALGRHRADQALPLWEAAQDRLKKRLGEPAWTASLDAVDRLAGAAIP